jgi:hypothetical protein
VGADFRLAAAEHARALRFQAVAIGDDVLDLVAEMVRAAFAGRGIPQNQPARSGA